MAQAAASELAEHSSMVLEDSVVDGTVPDPAAAAAAAVLAELPQPAAAAAPGQQQISR